VIKMPRDRHDKLSGLNHNDHPQYLLRDGSNIMTGDFRTRPGAKTFTDTIESTIIGGTVVINTDIGDLITIRSDDTTDPTLTFKTTNTVHEIDCYLDESATDDELFISGQTASVDTVMNLVAQDGENAILKLLSGTNHCYIKMDTNDHMQIGNSIQDKDIIFSFDDGGVAKTITIDASADSITHSAGTFNFDDDNITTTGTVTTSAVYLADNEKIYFGTGNDVELYFDGTNFKIEGASILPDSDNTYGLGGNLNRWKWGYFGTSGIDLTGDINTTEEIHIDDDKAIHFGSSDDASIFFDSGTYLTIKGYTSGANSLNLRIEDSDGVLRQAFYSTSTKTYLQFYTDDASTGPSFYAPITNKNTLYISFPSQATAYHLTHQNFVIGTNIYASATNSKECGWYTREWSKGWFRSVYIGEQASAKADQANFGQLWVKNTTPCELWFTDDAGTDTQIV